MKLKLLLCWECKYKTIKCIPEPMHTALGSCYKNILQAVTYWRKFNGKKYVTTNLSHQLWNFPLVHTWQAIRRYRSCCRAGNCPNSSSLFSDRVLLCALLKWKNSIYNILNTEIWCLKNKLECEYDKEKHTL